MSTEPTPVTVTMVSDFICPWCRIGEKRLGDAIASLPDGIAVDVNIKPFELNPDMQREGMDRKVYRSLKFGSWARSQQLDAGTVAAGQPDGVMFNYDLIERTPNTFAAHKLTLWAEGRGKEADVAHRILKAYFVEGRDIGDPDVLADIAGEAGLDAAIARAYLDDPETDAEARAALRETLRDGVSGVPQFNIEGTIIGGAQSAEVLADAIQAAASAKADRASEEA